jgi:FAD:protein FMN transferase
MQTVPRTTKEGGCKSAFLSFVLGTLALLAAPACGPPAPTETISAADAELASAVQLEGPSMGTRWHATVVGPPAQHDLQEVIQQALDGVDQRMSTYKSDSELSRFNQAEAEFSDFSPATLEVLRYSLDLAQRSGGAFDPTVMPLIELWGFGPKPAQEPPDAEALNQIMKMVGWQQVTLDAAGKAVKAHSKTRLDFSAVAKGYAVDQAFAALQRAGCTNFMIEVGGEIRTAGSNRSVLPWRIGIDQPVLDPSGQQHQVQDVIAVQNYAVATSGDYRNYREQDGQRISHIIDPRTGRPVGHKLASVTILAPTCMQADALATTVSVLGAEAGLKFLAKITDVEAYFILRADQGFQSRETPGFAAYRVATEGK